MKVSIWLFSQWPGLWNHRVVESVPLLTWEIPRWALMWAIAVAMFCALKGLSLRWARGVEATSGRRIAYLLLWPGMDARAFLTGTPRHPPEPSEWLAAAVKTLVGIGLLGLSRVADAPLLAGWIAMVGIIFTLHFGSFHLLSCFWRSRGIDAPPLMHRPMAATSVSAFWGRHWNVAFRDLTHRMVFQPLLRRSGARTALMGGFVFSGSIHELAITVPAGGGYGGPLLFFLLQGGAALVERSKAGKRLGLGKGWRGWLFTQGLLLATVALLFPPPFVLRIILPFLDFLHELAL
ncbi:membrane bound O-acyl transferase family-domain-containing protein [Luteolibacter sp. GHJ8]|uniref:Membrane bound O-acyl transferase family-domain-containing protein n=1 Tax=Luteolibacter rhizosphaerae TaxID=2989719 RepID=A0ABT3G432_9BACT|nr:membrane bound O-acyl transferase family-domain-containing protein [Luteolibacter rhizosphaerae]MCW1914602.1 membrane bound O-acyl transferase family-domain-containing protein [Luteolibacter rhizosphaerae]